MTGPFTSTSGITFERLMLSRMSIANWSPKRGTAYAIDCGRCGLDRIARAINQLGDRCIGLGDHWSVAFHVRSGRRIIGVIDRELLPERAPQPARTLH